MKKIFLNFFLICFIFFPFPVLANKGYVNFHTSQKYLSHLNHGYIALDQYNYALALKEFSQAKQINSELSAAYEGLAIIYEQTKNYGKAFEAYQTALNLISPKYANFYLEKIKILRKQEEVKKALTLYRTILSIRPEAGLQVMMGDKSFSEKKFSEAVRYFLKACKYQEEPQEYLKYIDVKQPNKEYEKFLVRKYIKDNLSYPEAHFKAGKAYLNQKDYENAIKEFSLAVKQIKVRTAEYDYINYLGQAYYKSGITGKTNSTNLEKSIQYFKEVLKILPNNADFVFNLANAYYYRDVLKMHSLEKELEEAENSFSEISDLSSNDPQYKIAKNNLDQILNKKFNQTYFNDAFETIKQINLSEKPPADFHYYLGNIFLKKALVYHKGYYDRHKFMNSEKYSALQNSWNYYEQAYSEYSRYTRLKPNNDGFIYYDLGVLFYHRSKLQPDNILLGKRLENKEYKRYGLKFYRRDMLSQAITNFRIYLSKNPKALNSAEVKNIIGEIQLALINI